MSAPKRMAMPSTMDLYRLDWACKPLNEVFGDRTYLVGSTMRVDPDRQPRDVDVRTILTDEDFDALFGGRAELWGLVCSSIGIRLAGQTGLNIDYQIQRMTEANRDHKGMRNPLGSGRRSYAGGGDATRFETPSPDPRKASE